MASLRDVDNEDPDLDPHTIRFPEIRAVPTDGLRAVDGATTDTLFVDFYGHALPAVSVAVDRGERDYLDPRVNPETGGVVGLQIEAVPSYAIRHDPALKTVRSVAELRGVDDLAALRLRREGRAGNASRWSGAAFLEEISRMIA